MSDINITLPPLYDKQRRAIYSSARYVWIEASTKSGKTAGCIVWQMDQFLQDTVGREHWWVAPVSGQAKIAYRRGKKMLQRAFRKAGHSPEKYIGTHETDRVITFIPTGSRWVFQTGEKPDNLYGEDVEDAVLDEASRMRREAWHAMRSTLTATRGPMRAIGNVKGRKNWFYKMSRLAEQGRDGHEFHRLTAWDAVSAGVLDEAEILDAKASLPDHVFRELYLAEPADDGSNPFGQDAIERQVAPMSTGRPVAWGWDLAKSVDWTVGIALDAEGSVCRLVRFQAPWEATISRIKAETSSPALVDSTGVGDPIMERLPRTTFRGYKFTPASKQQLMERLAVAIQSGEIRFPEGPIVDELLQFEYEHSRTGVKYSAPSGMHDDCVCALALAVMVWRQKRFAPPKVNIKPGQIDTDLSGSIDLGY